MDYLLHHLFLKSVQECPNKTAVKDGRVSLTYTDLSERAGHLAQELQNAGIKRGQRVAFYLDHDVEQAAAILAISAAGAVFVPISWALYPLQVGHILHDSEAAILITNRDKRPALEEEIKRQPGIRVLLAEEIKGKKPLERTCYCIENDLAALLYTSGSTGRPKGVMISHKNLVVGSYIISEYLHLTSRDRILGVLQLSFDYGLNQLVTMLHLGGTYRFLQYRFPNDIVQALKDDEITGLAGVPQIWAYLVRSSLAETDLPHLRYITNSGGPVPTHVLELLRKALPNTEIFLMYGLTEAFRSTYLPPAEMPRRPTSMGKAIPNNEILVIGENGRLCGPNEVGELVHRGPTVALGYWKNEEATAERYRAASFPEVNNGIPEIMVFSGDLVKRDDEGFLYFVGRRDTMLKCSGIRVSPTEIEEVVFQSGLVKSVAAIGIPDETAGHIIKIFVVPLANSPAQNDDCESRIMDHCSANLPNYMVPRFVEFIDEIPRTHHGKIDYNALKARA